MERFDELLKPWWANDCVLEPKESVMGKEGSVARGNVLHGFSFLLMVIKWRGIASILHFISSFNVFFLIILWWQLKGACRIYMNWYVLNISGTICQRHIYIALIERFSLFWYVSNVDNVENMSVIDDKIWILKRIHRIL